MLLQIEEKAKKPARRENPRAGAFLEKRQLN
jgi:hypothetical protein